MRVTSAILECRVGCSVDVNEQRKFSVKPYMDSTHVASALSSQNNDQKFKQMHGHGLHLSTNTILFTENHLADKTLVQSGRVHFIYQYEFIEALLFAGTL